MPSALNVSEGYEEFIQGVRLVNLGLKSCSAMLDREKWIALAVAKKKELRVLKEQYHATEIAERYFDIAAKFTVTVSESTESENVLTVECEFEAHFHAIGVRKQFVDRFATSDFRFVVTPYARQFISSITTQMAIPPLIMPLSTRVGGEPPAVVTAVPPKKTRRKITT